MSAPSSSRLGGDTVGMDAHAFERDSERSLHRGSYGSRQRATVPDPLQRMFDVGICRLSLVVDGTAIERHRAALGDPPHRFPHHSVGQLARHRPVAAHGVEREPDVAQAAAPQSVDHRPFAFHRCSRRDIVLQVFDPRAPADGARHGDAARARPERLLRQRLLARYCDVGRAVIAGEVC